MENWLPGSVLIEYRTWNSSPSTATFGALTEIDMSCANALIMKNMLRNITENIRFIDTNEFFRAQRYNFSMIVERDRRWIIVCLASFPPKEKERKQYNTCLC